jgi:hypothetical protein
VWGAKVNLQGLVGLLPSYSPLDSLPYEGGPDIAGSPAWR